MDFKEKIMRDVIQVMPAVALRGMTILPDMIVHFDVSRSKSKKAVERAMTGNQKLFVVTQRDPDIENPEKEELFTAGTIVTIKQMTKLQHGLIRVLVEAVERAELIDFLENKEFLEAEVTTANNEDDLDELPEEYGFLTEAMSEKAFAEKVSGLKGFISRLRIEEA